MKFEFFLADVFPLPLLARKRPARKSSIFFFALVFSLSLTNIFAAANLDAQATENVRQLVKLAKKTARRGALDEAEKLLRRAVEINPQESDARLNLAYVLVKRRQFLEAYNLSYETARAEPKNAFALAVLGMVFLNAGKLADAEVALVNALRIDRRNALAFAGLGMLNFYENRILLGLDQLKTAVYIDPLEPDFTFTLAQVATRAEDFKLAAETYETFLRISPQTDDERRARIKGLIAFLKFLSNRSALYDLSGAPETTVPFRLVNDRPVIEVKVNGDDDKPLNFVLDTGSGISVVSNETAKRLKLTRITRGGMARAVGGDGKFEIVYGFLRSTNIGGVKIRNVPVYIREFHNNDEKIDGYIGLALISKFLTTIDYGNSTFVLEKKIPTAPTSDGGANSQAQLSSLPLRLTSGGFLSGEVKLAGIETPLNFIVDTGASISVISSEIAGLKEINRFVSAQKMRIVGAAGITEEMPSFLLPKISFGANSCESVKAVALDLSVINETTGFEQVGILGGNFLKNYRLTFDFNNSKVLFVPIKQNGK